MSLLFNFPSVEIHCRPHIAKLLTFYLKRQGEKSTLLTNHWIGALLKRHLDKHNPSWNYDKLCQHYSVKFQIYISESEMSKYGCMLSPDKTTEFNNTIHKWFIDRMYWQVRCFRAEGLTENEAVLKSLAQHGLTDDDFSYEAAHSAIYRYEDEFVVDRE